MNQISKHICKATVFIFGLIGILLILSCVFAPKENEKNIGLIPPVLYGLIHEPKDSVDVLILGNSESHTSMIPLQIWDEYGYTTFSCGSQKQPAGQSNLLLNIAFDYQSPKVVIVETAMLYTYNPQMFFPILLYHNRWKSMYDERIDTLPEYIEMTETKNYRYSTRSEPADASNYMTPTNDCEEIPLINQFYLRCMKTCCEKNGAELLLVSSPSTINWNMMKHNGVAAFSKEINVNYIDMNTLQEEISIDWNIDTRDKGDHLNYFGAIKSTAYLGQYLSQTGLLISHKEDPSYASSWNSLVKKFQDSICE